MSLGRKGIKMLSCGIDTHQKMHQVEVQNNYEKVMWRGQVSNDRKGFNVLLDKLRTIEKSNSDTIKGIFMKAPDPYFIIRMRNYLRYMKGR
jgi:hypothetical protein